MKTDKSEKKVKFQEKIKELIEEDLKENKLQKIISKVQSENEDKENDNQTKSKRNNRIHKLNKVLTISYPNTIEVDEKGKNKRRYRVTINYTDENGVERRRVVKFGSIRQKDYLTDKDNKRRFQLLTRIQNADNVLQSNYWRKHYLNNDNEDLYDNFIQILKLNSIY